MAESCLSVSLSVTFSCCDAEWSQQQRWVMAVGVVEVGMHGGWCSMEGVVNGLLMHEKWLRHWLQAATGGGEFEWLYITYEINN